MTRAYLSRTAENRIRNLTEQFPAVAITGPRQVGKTSLAKRLAQTWPQPSVYLDLENPADLNKLQDPGLFLETLQDQTVILDEVQRVPSLFPVLRGLIDRNRRPRRFILLGSASPELIRDTSETLAGRIAYVELSPLSFAEVDSVTDYRTHWLRGGFPESLLAPNNAASGNWRENFIQTYLERDLPLLGLSANPVLSRRLWTMLAHVNGNILNYDALSNSLGVTAPTVRRYIDFFESSYLIRRLQPWFVNISKRIVKSPKIYIRDTGILHSLLGIGDFSDLEGRPIIGASWEACVLQEIAAQLPSRYEICFYRTQDGTEADIVLVKAGIPEILIEVKYSSAPNPGKGSFIAAQDLQTKRNFIVAPVAEGYPVKNGFEVMPYAGLKNLFE